MSGDLDDCVMSGDLDGGNLIHDQSTLFQGWTQWLSYK